MTPNEWQGPRLYRAPIEAEIRSTPEPEFVTRHWTDPRYHLQCDHAAAWRALQQWTRTNECYTDSEWAVYSSWAESHPELARLVGLARAFDGNSWDR